MRTKQGYAGGPNGRIHYQMTGEGPLLLLCHQFSSSSPGMLCLLAGTGVWAACKDTGGN